MKGILSLTLLSLVAGNVFGMDGEKKKINMMEFLQKNVQYKPKQSQEQITGHSLGKPPYEPKGHYSTRYKRIHPDKINSVINNAPRRIQVIISNLKNSLDDEYKRPNKLLLTGPSGVGKTLLAKAIALTVKRRYYYIKTPYILDSWKNCHQNLLSEINPLIERKEPLIVIFDEIDEVTKRDKNSNSSDSNVSSAFWLMLDECDMLAPHLFIIGTSNNDKIDFPEQVKTRFGRDIITISLPNLATREQIILHVLKDTKHTLSDAFIHELAISLNGRNCRNIEKIMIEAQQNANYSNSNIVEVKPEHIELTLQENPLDLSEDEILANEMYTTVARVREIRRIKAILEKHRNIIDHYYKKEQYRLAKEQQELTKQHHNETLVNSNQQHRQSQELSRAQHQQNLENSRQQHYQAQALSRTQHQQNLDNAKRGLLFSYVQSLISSIQLNNNATMTGRWFNNLGNALGKMRNILHTNTNDLNYLMRNIYFQF